MLQFNEEDLKAAVVQKAADEILSQDHDLGGMIEKEVKKRIDAIFTESVQAQIESAINATITSGFDRQYQRVDRFGTPQGEVTTIRAELDKLVGGYWNTNVDPRSGEPTSSTYGTKVTRAEFLMTQICAKDFSETMKQAALSVTGTLKDGFRGQIAKHMDELLDSLFRVRSLQDQGKVEKPY